MKKAFFGLLVLVGAVVAFPLQAADPLHVGLLAKRGAAKTNVRWLGHSAYLAPKIGREVIFVPLKFTEVDAAAGNETVDFLLVNSSMFVDLQDRYGAEPIVTMVNQTKFHQKTTLFGGVILTSAESSDIDDLMDVDGRTFYAVKKTSLGGFQAALKEFLDKDIDLGEKASEIVFMDTHDAVVQAVIGNPGTVGTVRTDTLERMVWEGKIVKKQVKVLNDRREELDFPFQVSTSLYPEWPLAMLPSTERAVADAVAQALLDLDHSDFAARSANIAGWSLPERYDSVRLLHQALRANE